MARFFGIVGYATAVEVQDGVWENTIVEKSYFGDVLRNSVRIQEGRYLNDDLSVGNSISVVADAFANQNFSAIRYVKWSGGLWKVDSIEVQAPRLILRLGGVYNGQVAAPVGP